MLTHARVLGVLFGLALTVSCGDDGGSGSGGETDSGMPATTTIGVDCMPGEQLDCTCADGSMGTQMCLPSGMELGPCMCGSASTTGTTTSGSTGSTTATTGTTTATTGTGSSDTGTSGSDTGTSTSTSG